MRASCSRQSDQLDLREYVYTLIESKSRENNKQTIAWTQIKSGRGAKLVIDPNVVTVQTYRYNHLKLIQAYP